MLEVVLGGMALELVEQYAYELRRYVDEGGEAPLRRAYELGRKAAADGLGVLEMVTVHQQALIAILEVGPGAARAQETVRRAGEFLAEALSPFEMALRGFREANARLRASLEELEAFQE